MMLNGGVPGFFGRAALVSKRAAYRRIRSSAFRSSASARGSAAGTAAGPAATGTAPSGTRGVVTGSASAAGRGGKIGPSDALSGPFPYAASGLVAPASRSPSVRGRPARPSGRGRGGGTESQPARGLGGAWAPRGPRRRGDGGAA